MGKFDEKLKRMIDSDVNEIPGLIWRIENDDRYVNLIKYINSSEHMRNYYSSIDIEKRKKELLEIITDITSALASEHDFRKNILNLLEYMRINVSYENIGEIAGSLSQNAYNCAILGKAVCSGQSNFFNMLLRSAGIISYRHRSRFDLVDGFEDHAVVCIVDDNRNSYLLDPTVNDGVLDSNGYFLMFDPSIDDSAIGNDGHIREDLYGKPAYKRKEDYGENTEGLPEYYQALKFTKAEVLEARKKVYEYCLKKYDDLELFKNPIVEGKDIKEKILNIAKKIEKYAILPENMEEYDYDLITINLNGFEMEIGKCFELLLYANNIEFDLVANGRDRRKNTSYIDIKDNNYEYVINTNNLYSINKPQKRWLAELLDGKLKSSQLETEGLEKN